MQNHSLDHRTVKTGCRHTFLGRQAPTHQLPGSHIFYILSSGGGQNLVASPPCALFFLKRGHGSCGLTPHRTQIKETGWVGTEEEARPSPTNPHLYLQHQLPRRERNGSQWKSATAVKENTQDSRLARRIFWICTWLGPSVVYDTATSWDPGSRDRDNAFP